MNSNIENCYWSQESEQFIILYISSLATVLMFS